MTTTSPQSPEDPSREVQREQETETREVEIEREFDPDPLDDPDANPEQE